jgi:hypothetical protein
VRVLDLDCSDLAEAGAVKGLPIVPQEVEGEPHILGRERTSVGKPGPGIEVERDGAAVVRHLGRVGDKAVDRERLVEGAHHQALEHVSRYDVRSDPDHDQGIEAVERALECQDDSTAFRSLRVGV